MKNNAINELIKYMIEIQDEIDAGYGFPKLIAKARSLALERPTQRQEGKCPTCHGAIRTTERRPDGDSVCAFGHKHKTADFYKPTPPPQSLVEALEELVKECRGKHYDYKYPASINVSEIEEILAKFKGATK